jgi:hypothetical protein
VYLNIYDISPLNHYLYWFGLGIFHSGIEGKVSTTPIYTLIIHIFYEKQRNSVHYPTTRLSLLYRSPIYFLTSTPPHVLPCTPD